MHSFPSFVFFRCVRFLFLVIGFGWIWLDMVFRGSVNKLTSLKTTTLWWSVGLCMIMSGDQVIVICEVRESLDLWLVWRVLMRQLPDSSVHMRTMYLVDRVRVRQSSRMSVNERWKCVHRCGFVDIRI